MANNEFGRLQPVAYDDYPSSPTESSPDKQGASKKAPPGKKIATARGAETGKNFSSEAPEKIGDQCEDRLPLASVVFLYGPQHKTGSEQVFQGLMSKLAQEEAAATEARQRVKSLESRIVKLEKQGVRIAESTNVLYNAQGERLKAQGDEIKAYINHVDAIEEKLAKVTAHVQALQTQVSEAASAAASQQAEKDARKEARQTAKRAEAEETAAAAVLESDPSVVTIKQELDVLFLDRDNILAMVEEGKTRLTIIEENIRALTLQRGAATMSPASLPHHLSSTTPDEIHVDLGVPKSMAHADLKKDNGLNKENSPFRNFTPGKSWH